jgi:hypothetical protein
MQTDRGCPIRSNFDRAGKNLAQRSAATQTWPKFGRGLRRRGLTVLSARVLLPHPGSAHQWHLDQTPPNRFSLPTRALLPACRHPPAAATSASHCRPPTRGLLWPAAGGLCSHFPAARSPHMAIVGLVLGHLLPRPRGVRPFARPVFR